MSGQKGIGPLWLWLCLRHAAPIPTGHLVKLARELQDEGRQRLVNSLLESLDQHLADCLQDNLRLC